AGIRGGVELEQVHEAPRVDVDPGRARAAGGRGYAVRDAVEALGEDARDRRLAHAARSGEQIRVVQPPALERVRERAHDVLLPGKLGKALRAPLAGEGL